MCDKNLLFDSGERVEYPANLNSNERSDTMALDSTNDSTGVMKTLDDETIAHISSSSESDRTLSGVVETGNTEHDDSDDSSLDEYYDALTGNFEIEASEDNSSDAYYDALADNLEIPASDEDKSFDHYCDSLRAKFEIEASDEEDSFDQYCDSLKRKFEMEDSVEENSLDQYCNSLMGKFEMETSLEENSLDGNGQCPGGNILITAIVSLLLALFLGVLLKSVFVQNNASDDQDDGQDSSQIDSGFQGPTIKFVHTSHLTVVLLTWVVSLQSTGASGAVQELKYHLCET